MGKHGEQPRDGAGAADASRREAGPAPDFALVRPYVGSLGDEAGGDELTGDGLATAALAGDEPTAVQPLVGRAGSTHRRYGRRSKVSVDPPDATKEIVYPRMPGVFGPALAATAARRRRWPRYTPLVLGLAVIVVIGIVAAVTFRPMPTAPASESFMPVPATIPSFAPTVESAPSSVASSVPAKPSRPKKPRASSSPSAPASARPSAGYGPGGGPVISPSPSPPPPAPQPVGAITGVGGLCVDDNGRLTNNGNPIQVYTCNGTAAQIWTVAANGSLQVIGKCMRVANSQVVLWDCDGSSGEIWHSGNGFLVNPATGKCLDDPRWTMSGGHLDVARCSGAANQRWTLPAS